MKKITALLLTVLLLAAIFCGCAKQSNAAVVGRWAWEYEGLGEVMIFTFREDGTGTMESFGDTKDITYTVSDSKIHMTVGEETASCPFRFEDGKMLLTIYGEVLKLTKTD